MQTFSASLTLFKLVFHEGKCYLFLVKKCQYCGKPATIFMTQIVSGEMTELILCSKCAKERGLLDPQSLAFAEKFFPDAIKEKIENIVRDLAPQKDLEALSIHASNTDKDMLAYCPSCNFTLEELSDTGRLGCPDCYAIFAMELSEALVIQNFTGTSSEKTNKKISPKINRTTQITLLENQLQAAIKSENFEQAAQLRDEITQLKNSHEN